MSRPAPRLLPDPGGALSLLLARYLLSEKPQPVLLVCADGRRADMLERQLRFFCPLADVLPFPAWDCLPYDRVSPSASVSGQRVAALARLGDRSVPPPDVVVTTVRALSQRVPLPNAFLPHVRAIRKGAALGREGFLRYLVENGYRRTSCAYESGEFAVRGSILDVVPADAEEGVRIDCFGDAVEQIRRFDPETQLSGERMAEYRFVPASELPVGEKGTKRFIAGYLRLFGIPKGHDALYDHIAEGRPYAGAEHWLPLFHEEMATLPRLLPANALLIYDRLADQAFREHLASVKDCYETRKEAASRRGKEDDSLPSPPLPPETLYLTEEEWRADAASRDAVALRQESTGGSVAFPAPAAVADAPDYDLLSKQEKSPALELLKRDVKAHPERRFHIACVSEHSRERLAELMREAELHPVLAESLERATEILPRETALYVLPFERGVVVDGLCLLSEQDVLGERLKTGSGRRRKAENYLKEAASLLPGEFVVHESHGIGKFVSLENVVAAGKTQDCLKIEYRDGDVLFVPVEYIGLLSRYGSEGSGVVLDKLGRDGWQRRKAAMKNRIRDIAARMLKIAGERALREAPVMTAERGAYEAFCARFPYVETEDQLRSAGEVEEDLASGRPMDRLLCGDVGFGKTEIALRAAFLASCGENPHQTAVIAPTTLLARQHLGTFRERFSRLGVRVEGLSRLTPPKAAKDIKKAVAEGQVDIVIGTHALLAKSMKFNCLGLVVIDEEQQFGVLQKERLKEMRASAHVLSMSATPIPRTLQMALSGIKDLSLMTTPPTDRLEIRTFVSPFDRVVVRNAILREQYRGGRCFFVAPRIADLALLKETLRETVPEASVAVAHGQTPPQELEEIMTAFYDGAYDVLLSTNIVGSGIDLPTANTMFVYRADMFGLAQLYQMRGRVGRGKVRAYAYLLLPEGRLPSEQAQRRLEILHRLDSLGAGFSVASHDMDMRGFGNLLGDEQSGHVREVGVELYQDMLRDAIEELKAREKGEERTTSESSFMPELHLGVNMLIPGTYVRETELRMGLYRRIGFAETEGELDALGDEMRDRFGPLPEEADALLQGACVRLLCRAGGIGRIDAGPKGASLSFDPARMKKPDAVIAYAAKRPVDVKIKGENKLAVLRDWQDVPPRTRLRETRLIVKAFAEAQGG
jgi:transcription-repair coupling factor (superfamily II helicase)